MSTNNLFTMTAAKLAANRRNALKSTGPRTSAGKRRAGLNALKRSLCAPEFEKLLRSRGQDPREFRDLHRDLIAIFHPKERATFVAVESLARTWWDKACRIRAWVGAGNPRVDDLDGRLDEQMNVLVLTKRLRHEWWQAELVSVLGQPCRSPAAVRGAIETRLALFGGRKRKYPRRRKRADMLEDFEVFRKMVEKIEAQDSGLRRNYTEDEKRTQTNPRVLSI